MAERVSQALRFNRKLLHPRYWPMWLIFAVLTTTALLPYRWLDKLAILKGRLFYRIARKHCHLARTNIAWCFPEMDARQREKLLLDYCINYIQALLMMPKLWFGSKDNIVKRFSFEDRHYFDKAHAESPVILLSCHALMLEFSLAAFAQQYSAVTMYKKFKTPFIEWLILRARTRFNNCMVARGDGLRPLIKLVRSGVPCYHMPDEDLGKKGALFAPFFQHPKATLPSMAKMTRTTKAQVVPCYPQYLGRGQFKFTFLPALQNYPGDDTLENAMQLNNALETIIRIAPAQYLWKLRLFKNRPNGAQHPYYENKRN